jgi:predicted nucleic acid-binding protein
MPIELGWLDTNIFVHALMLGDTHQARCRDVLQALQDGRAEGWIAPSVVHELSYVLTRLPTFKTRSAIAIYLSTLLSYPGVAATDKTLLITTVGRWAAGRLSFIDALLTELAQRDGRPVCTVNARDFPTTPNSYATVAL